MIQRFIKRCGKKTVQPVVSRTENNNESEIVFVRADEICCVCGAYVAEGEFLCPVHRREAEEYEYEEKIRMLKQNMSV